MGAAPGIQRPAEPRGIDGQTTRPILECWRPSKRLPCRISSLRVLRVLRGSSFALERPELHWRWPSGWL